MNTSTKIRRKGTVFPGDEMNRGMRRHVVLRGGRLRKTACGIVTLAPWLGLVTAVAMGMGVTAGGDAFAQQNACTGTATVICRGAVTATQTFSAEANEMLIVADESDFSITTTSGRAFDLSTDADSTGMQVDLHNAIRSQFEGVKADHMGSGPMIIMVGDITTDGADYNHAVNAISAAKSGAMTITANGDISSSAGEGISTSHAGAGLLSISFASGRTITASSSFGVGINARTQETASGGVEIISLGSVGTSSAGIGTSAINALLEGEGDVSITAADAFSASAEAINVRMGDGTPGETSSADGNVSVTTTGTIAALGADVDDARGIQVDHYGVGDITISTSGSVSGATGIAINTGSADGVGDGVGAVSITIGGSVTGSGGSAIDIRGGTSQRLIFNPGASVSGTVTASRTTDAILEFAATTVQTSGNSFALTDLDGFTGFADFDKTGDGTWEFTGAQGEGMNEFTSADIEAGTLRLNAATFRLAGNGEMTIATGATLDIDGTSILHGDLLNRGTVALGSTDSNGAAADELTIMGNADVRAGSVRLNAATLRVSSGNSMTVASGATLDIDGTSILHGDLVNSGNLALGSTNSDGAATDEFTIMGEYTAGGSVTLDVDVDSGAVDKLVVMGDVNNQNSGTTVHLRATGNKDNPMGLRLRMTESERQEAEIDRRKLGGIVLIEASLGDSTAQDFTAGNIHFGSLMYDFTLMHDLEVDDVAVWTVASIDGNMVTFAPDCLESRNEDGTRPDAGARRFICSGTASTTQTFEIFPTQALSITDAREAEDPDDARDTPHFVANITEGNAFTIRPQNNSHGLEIDLEGDVTATKGHGIYATSLGSEDGQVKIKVGNLTAGRDAINVMTDNSGFVTGEDGDNIDIEITTTGTITAGTFSTGVTPASGTGIYAHAEHPMADIVITLGGPVVSNSASNAKALEIMGGMSHKLILNPGAGRFTGTVTSDKASGTILELTGVEDTNGSFALAELDDFTNFVDFDKTGAGTWQLTGAQGTGMNEFASVDVMAGTLRFMGGTSDSPTVLRLSSGNNLTVASGATLEIDGITMVHGDLDNEGTLAFGYTAENGDTDDMLTITGGYTTGGSVTFNVNTNTGEADQLVIMGGVTMENTPTTVNLRAESAITATKCVTVPTNALIAVTGSGSDNDFMAGMIYHGTDIGGELAFSLTRDNSGNWNVSSVGSDTSLTPAFAMASETGTYVCNGTAPTTQRLTAGREEMLLVTDMADFEVNVGSGNAVELIGEPGSTGMMATFDDGNIAATGRPAADETAHGIYAKHEGSGDVYIRTEAVSSMHDRGIHLETAATSGEAEIFTNGMISAGTEGIHVEHDGTGKLSISTRDQVMAANAGIDVVLAATNTDGIEIETHDKITATAAMGDGIRVDNDGVGNVLVTLGEEATLLEGIESMDAGIEVDSSDSPVPNGMGDPSLAFPAGVVTVTTHAPISAGGKGIHVTGGVNTGAVTIETMRNVNSGTRQGIHIDQMGIGNVEVTALGAVTTGMGTPTGMQGIFVDNKGLGTTTITAGAVTVHDNSHGIEARGNPSTGAMSITVDGAFMTGMHSILADHKGTRDIAITLEESGSLTSTGGRGISATGAPSVRHIIVTTAGAVTSNESVGIWVHKMGRVNDEGGEGNVEITATGAITTGEGASTGLHGIFVNNDGLEDTSITTGDITVHDDNRGIHAEGAESTNHMSITATGTINTGGAGIFADHDGRGALNIAVESTGSLTSTGNVGIDASSYAASGAVTIVAEGAIMADMAGIRAFHAGNGMLSITTAAVTSTTASGIDFDALSDSAGTSVTANGKITATASGGSGIEGEHLGTGMLSITAGAIDGGQAGVSVGTIGSGAAGISIETTGDVTGDRGIGAWKRTSGALAITAAAVTAEVEEGILAFNLNTEGDTTVTTNGAVSGKTYGIRVDADDQVNTGAVVVSLGGSVTGTDGKAIDLKGGASQKLVLNPGSGEFTGSVTASDTSAILELASTASATAETVFALTELSDFTNLVNFDKTGDGIWELTGVHAMGTNEFASADVVTGTLRFMGGTTPNPTVFRLSCNNPADTADMEMMPVACSSRSGELTHNDPQVRNDMTILPNGTLEIDGHSELHGDLVNRGVLALGSSDKYNMDNYEDALDEFRIMGSYVKGGTLTLNANLDTGQADKLYIMDGVTGLDGVPGTSATILNIRAIGNVNSPKLGERTPGEGPVVLVDVTGRSSNTDFAAGKLHVGSAMYDFVLVHNAGSWSVMSVNGRAVAPPPPPGCEEQAQGGTYICMGRMTETETLTAEADETLIVTDEIDFTAVVESGSAFRMRGESRSRGMMATFENVGEITASGTGNQAGHGIDARHQGTGDISIATTSIDTVVTSVGGRGVNLVSAGTSMNATISIMGAITAGTDGIHADHGGIGTLTVNTMSTVSAASDAGIVALLGDVNTGGLVIRADDKITTSGTGVNADGIRVDNDGSGEITILTEGIEGDIIDGGDGIWVENASFVNSDDETTSPAYSPDSSVVVSAEGLINVRRYGIYVSHMGTGPVSITSTGGIMTSLNDAIFAKTESNRLSGIGGMTITAIGSDIGRPSNPVGSDGIKGVHRNNGDLTIMAGKIFATRHGIDASTGMKSGALTITVTEEIAAGENAVEIGDSADSLLHNDSGHRGSGQLNISTMAPVTSTTRSGIVFLTASDDENMPAAGTGVTITANGKITATSAGHSGIRGEHRGSGMLKIITDAIDGGRSAIQVDTPQPMNGTGTDAGIDIETKGDVTGDRGIGAWKRGSGALSIKVENDLTADVHEAILANNWHPVGDTTVLTTGNVTGRTYGIRIDADGENDDITNSGDVVIELGGSVIGTDGTAIDIDGGMSQKLILNAGASTVGAVNADRTDAVLELKARNLDDSDSFDLDVLSDYVGFVDFDKTGSGTWELTGEQPTGKEFSSADVLAGTLRLDTANLRLSGNDDHLTIAEMGTLEVVGTSIVHGDLVNDGSLAFHLGGDDNTDETLTITDYTTGNGMVTFNINLDTGASDKLMVSGSVTRGTGGADTINLLASGDVDNPMLGAGGVVLVDLTGSDPANASADGDFVAGELVRGSMRYGYTLMRDATSGDWLITDVLDSLGDPILTPFACTEQSTDGTFICSGTTITTEALGAESGERLVVTDTAGFSINVPEGDDPSLNNAFTLTGATGSTGMNVTLDGNIASTAGAGIHATHMGSGTVSITTTGSVSGMTGMVVNVTDTSSAVVVTLGGPVRGTAFSSPVAIDMDGGASQKLVLNPGASITGAVHADRADAILELAGAPDDQGRTSFNLSRLSGFTNFVDFDKTGDGAWELTGEQPIGKEFTSADVLAGTLRLKAATLRLSSGNDLTVASGGTLEVDGTSMLHGDLINSGTLALSADGVVVFVDADDMLTVTGGYVKGGIVTLDVDLANGTADQLIVRGGVSGTSASRVDIRASGDINNPILPTAPLIRVTGTSNDNDFEEGELLLGARTYDFDLRHSSGVWTLANINVESISADASTYESYIGTITELSRLSSMQERMIGRKWSGEENKGAWALLEGFQGEFEPGRTFAGSQYTIRSARARFGIEIPVGETMSFGGSVAFTRAESDVSSLVGDGEIETEGVSVAATTGLMFDEGLYLDAQLQFSDFTSELSSNDAPLVRDNGSTSFSVSGEMGYRIPFEGVTIVPQAQLTWTAADFDEFTDDTMAVISPADGDTFSGRFGITLEREWQDSPSVHGRYYGRLDLRAPLDGETIVNFAGDSLYSDKEALAADIGLGASYSFEEGGSLFGEMSTTQGVEVKEFRATVGLRLDF